jgi:phosphoribosylformylglycinamidine cyclo-ligase
MHFADKIHIIKDKLFPLPLLFRIIREQSGTGWEEMYRVFNMGHRFEVYTDEKSSHHMIDIAARYNLEARIVGHCESNNSKKLTIKSEFGTFSYES